MPYPPVRNDENMLLKHLQMGAAKKCIEGLANAEMTMYCTAAVRSWVQNVTHVVVCDQFQQVNARINVTFPQTQA